MDSIDTKLQELHSKMIEEKGGATLTKERQEHYIRESRKELQLLGALNPAAVDPTKEMEAFRRIREEVSCSGYW